MYGTDIVGTKSGIDELAVFGNPPLFSAPLPVGRPNIGDRGRFVQYVNDILDRRCLSNNGPYVQAFERHVAARLGVKHCVAMCNGTVALEIAIRALGLKGEVILPSYTFIATAHALQWQEITPVFCDIQPRTHTIDPAQAERLITPRTTGIIGVHLWGETCDVDGLADVAARHNLALMFDAAHAFGCSYRGVMVGNFGAAEVLSFHATKFLNAVEGGAVVTNDDALAEKMRLMRNFGFSGYDCVRHLGTNGKMTELSAAMGLTNLECMDEFREANRRNYLRYRRELRGIRGLRVYPYDEKEQRNYQYAVVEIDEDRAGISRDLLLTVLHAENIIARRYFYPGCHRMEPYRSYFPFAGMLLPETERVAAAVIVLPAGATLAVREIDEICRVIRLAAQHGAELRRRGVPAAAQQAPGLAMAGGR